MSRPPRICFPGATYHVLNRFVDKHPFFHDDEDYRFFLETYFEIAASFQLRTFTYCVMSNHFHVVLETPEGGISHFLQRFLSRVARELNQRRGRTGHLFQARTRTLLIENEQYFETANAYVLLNPIRAGITSDLFTYPWSSVQAILRADPRLDLETLAERVAGRKLLQGPIQWGNTIMSWLKSLEESEIEEKFSKGIRGQFISSARFRKERLALAERRAANQIPTDARMRRFSDRPRPSWGWEEISAAVHHVVNAKNDDLAGWRNADQAAAELRVWTAYVLGHWTLDRLQAAEADRHGHSRYSMILKRLRDNPAKMRVADLIRQRVSDMHIVTLGDG